MIKAGPENSQKKVRSVKCSLKLPKNCSKDNFHQNFALFSLYFQIDGHDSGTESDGDLDDDDRLNHEEEMDLSK